MKILEFKFDIMPDTAQFCTDAVIFAFHEVGFIEFKAYCMINSMARPFDIKIEKIGKNIYICHVLTECEISAMSEKCILLSGKFECREVNQQLRMTVRQEIIENEQ